MALSKATAKPLALDTTPAAAAAPATTAAPTQIEDQSSPWDESMVASEPAATPTRTAAPAPAPARAAASLGVSALVEERGVIESEGHPDTRFAAMQRADTGSSLPVVQNRGGSLGQLSVLDDDGFDALDDRIGFGSFPMVKLDKAMFECDGKEFDRFKATVMMTKKKYIVKASSSEDAELFYTYDKVETTSGDSVDNRIASWIAEGKATAKSIQTKEYQEVVAIMRDGPLEGSVVLLSIPPASIARLAGVRAEIAMLKNRKLRQVILDIFPGAKLKSNNGKSFHPWNFKYAGPAPANDDLLPE